MSSIQLFIVHIDLKGVHIEDIRTYLLQQGWTSASKQPDPRVEYFFHQKFEAVLMLPISTRLSDFYPRLREALERLAQVEERDGYHVVQQFLEAKGDANHEREVLAETASTRIVKNQDGSLSPQEYKDGMWLTFYYQDGYPVQVPNNNAGLEECKAWTGIEDVTVDSLSRDSRRDSPVRGVRHDLPQR